jgi:hypothetical protein
LGLGLDLGLGLSVRVGLSLAMIVQGSRRNPPASLSDMRLGSFSFMRPTLGLEILPPVQVETVLDSPSNRKSNKKREPRAPKGPAGEPR